MRKFKILIGLLIIFSCKKEEVKFPSLNVDPLTSAYKKNKIEYYLKIIEWKGKIVYVDSVNINSEGYITDEIRKYGYRNENHYKYDSINRIIEYHHKSDIFIDSKMKYELDLKNHQVLVNNKNKDSILWRYKFDDKMELLKEELLILSYPSKPDTIFQNLYTYKEKRIIQILKRNVRDGLNSSKKFYYNKHNVLIEIEDFNHEHQYISSKTGLIDSILNRYPDERTYYKYFKRS